MTRRIQFLTALMAGLVSLDLHAAALYYTETGWSDSASRIDPVPGIAGASRETLETLPNVDPRGIAVDNVNGHVYYSSGFSIKRANLDGAGATTILTASSGIGDVEVDPVGGKLYYSTIFAAPTDGIWSAALDGSGATLLHDAVTLAAAGAEATITTRDVFNIKVDADLGLLYWTADDGGVAGRTALNVSSIAGGGASQLWVAAGRSSAIDKMAIDFDSDTLYYSVGSTSNEIRRSALDNSGLVTLVSGVGRPGALAIDVAGDDLYFWVGNTLYAGALDGSGLVSRSFVGSALFDVSDMELGISVVPLPPAIALCVTALMGLGAIQRRRLARG